MKRWFCLFSCVVIILTGCAGKTAQQGEIKSLEDLKGKKVGVMLGNYADLTVEAVPEYRNMAEFVRYDDMVGILLALQFRKLDAMIMDEAGAKVFVRMTGDHFQLHKGLSEPLPNGFSFSNETHSQEMLQRFNAFIGEFRKTEEYADIMQRTNDVEKEPFVSKKVENIVTTDEVIRAVFEEGSETVAYIDPATGELCGMSLEIMTHFANSIGARLEVTSGPLQACILAVSSGQVDVFPYTYGLASKEACEMQGLITLSDEVFERELALITKK